MNLNIRNILNLNTRKKLKMYRYGNNLIHWKTLSILCPSKCYTGDEYTESNTRLGMNLRFKEHDLKNLEEKNKKEPNPDVESNINSLKNEIKEMRQKYETEKSQLISNASYQMFLSYYICHFKIMLIHI